MTTKGYTNVNLLTQALEAAHGAMQDAYEEWQKKEAEYERIYAMLYPPMKDDFADTMTDDPEDEEETT